MNNTGHILLALNLLLENNWLTSVMERFILLQEQWKDIIKL